MTKAKALELIQRILSSTECDSDTCDQIADVMRSAGYPIADDEEDSK